MHQDVDDAIIALLVEDTRATHKGIADSTGLPESTVRARIGRLIGTGRVVPSVLVHPEVESQRFVYMLRIRLMAGVSEEQLLEEPVFASTPWAARSAASGMVFVQLAALTMDDMLVGLERARECVGVDELTYSLVNRIYVGAHWRPRTESPTPWAAAPTRAVDATDRLLIDSLRLNGRASYTELATVSGLTVAATRRRVLRLVEDGVIRFATTVEGGSPGSQEASIDLVVGAADVAAFIHDAVQSSALRYVIEQSGEYNLACYAVAPDTAVLAAAVAQLSGDERVRRFNVDPFLVLRDRLSWNEI